MGGTRSGIIAGAVLALSVVGQVPCAATLIDDFSSADTTLLSLPPTPNVAQSTVGSTTVVDPNLPDVLGGTRTLTVQADSLANLGIDQVVVGVEPLGSFLCYNSTAGAAGRFTLLYDADGAGLNVNLLPALGIRIDIFDVDVAAPPYDVTVTLTDTNANSASFTRTVLTQDPRGLRFPFQDFAGVDVSSIFSVQVQIHPMNVAADFRVDRIATFGPATSSAPLLSPQMLLALAGLLLIVGRRALRAF